MKVKEIILSEIKDLNRAELITYLNDMKIFLHNLSPFKSEPVDCILWVESEKVQANDYNPNKVAPPEMELLTTSIKEDGYTQPIVTFDEGHRFQVVDGFHRNRVGKENIEINQRIHNYLPIVIINTDRIDKSDRIASTIRHNRARGRHQVEAMSDIVIELKRRNWSDTKIAKELGMEPDEILRLSQISGLAEIFANQEFSQAWESINENIIDIDLSEDED